MNEVLSAVRQMRERLLEAHRATEDDLTLDAKDLKRVLEGAIEDIEELHTEVTRKKQLSLHNEQIADEFRDRMSTKLRAIVQNVNDFKSSQDTQYNDLRGVVADMKDERQKQSAALSADVNRLNAAVSNTFQELIQRAQEIQATRTTRITRGKEDAAKHLQQLQTAIEKTQEVIVRRINTLREQTNELSIGMSTWNDKVRIIVFSNCSTVSWCVL